MIDLSVTVPTNWREVLSPADRSSLTDEGFLHVRAAADERALDAMRTAWARGLEAPAGPIFLKSRGNNDGPTALEQAPEFRHCLEHPYVMSAVAQVLDGDVVLMAFRGRAPNRGTGQQSLHVDDAKPVPPDRQCLVNVFWLLDDMDESNGATRVVPGSHRFGRTPGKELLRRDTRHPQARAIRARAGDVLVFSAHLWHAGSENRSGAPRRIAMAHFARREVVETRARILEGQT